MRNCAKFTKGKICGFPSVWPRCYFVLVTCKNVLIERSLSRDSEKSLYVIAFCVQFDGGQSDLCVFSNNISLYVCSAFKNRPSGNGFLSPHAHTHTHTRAHLRLSSAMMRLMFTTLHMTAQWLTARDIFARTIEQEPNSMSVERWVISRFCVGFRSRQKVKKKMLLWRYSLSIASLLYSAIGLWRRSSTFFPSIWMHACSYSQGIKRRHNMSNNRAAISCRKNVSFLPYSLWISREEEEEEERRGNTIGRNFRRKGNRPGKKKKSKKGLLNGWKNWITREGGGQTDEVTWYTWVHHPVVVDNRGNFIQRRIVSFVLQFIMVVNCCFLK